MRTWIFLFCLMVSMAQGAIDWRQYQPVGYVNDFAEILQPAQLEKVEALVRQINSRYGVQMAFVVVPTLETYDSAEVAEFFYDYWNIGKNSNDNAVLMLLTRDGFSHLYIGDGLLAVLDEQWENAYANEMAGYLEQGDSRRALVAGIRSIAEQVGRADAVGVATAATSQNTRHKFGDTSRRSFNRNGAGNMGGGLPMVAIVAAAFGGFLLVSTMVRAGNHANKTFYDYGRGSSGGFERGRTGPFGNKRPMSRRGGHR